MTAAADRLRAAGIVNAWNAMQQAVEHGYDGPPVFITYYPSTNDRMARSARWVVASPYFKTDPGGYFLDYGCKTFTVYGTADRAPKLAEAQQWCIEKYGLLDGWVKIAGLPGAWFPAAAALTIRRLLKAQP